MDKVALSFSTNAKLEKLIGRELITNNIIAIFELIKNSYDAFAHNAIVSFEGFDISSKDLGKVRHSERVISNVDSRIIIKDDGVGMSFEEVKTKWMEIGTTSKENTYIEKSLYSSEDKRVINGEKGIGRFGADKLGSLLRLISVGADGYEKTTLEIDWEMALGNLIVGCIWCITIVGIPFGKQFFKMARLSFMPFGASVIG